MRVLIAAVIGLSVSMANAQGICFRPGGESLALCLTMSNNIGTMAQCGVVIENFNREVDEWQKCRLDALDQEYRDKRQSVLDQAALLKNRTAETLKTRAASR